MGYTTDFTGKIKITPAMQPNHIAYLQAFVSTRRMKRNADIAETLPDELRIAVGLPIGEDGAYYVGSHSAGYHGQSRDESIIDYNEAPGQLEYGNGDFNTRYQENKKRIMDGKCQPGLWCQWMVADDGKTIEWDGGEKFYYYTEWMRYLIDHFFSKWGYTLNGTIRWKGEDRGDKGKIIVEANNVTTN